MLKYLKHFFIGLGTIYLVKQIMELPARFAEIPTQYHDKFGFSLTILFIAIIYITFAIALGSCMEDLINLVNEKINTKKK